MSYLGDISIDGDVQKLAQIGQIQGNLFVVNDALRNLDGAVDATPTISIVVGSVRFGRKVRLRISKDLAVGLLTERLIDILALPRGRRITELELQLVFKYGIVFSGQSLAPNVTVGSAGVGEGDQVELVIELGWEDPITGRKASGGRRARRGTIRYRK